MNLNIFQLNALLTEKLKRLTAILDMINPAVLLHNPKHPHPLHDEHVKLLKRAEPVLAEINSALDEINACIDEYFPKPKVAPQKSEELIAAENVIAELQKEIELKNDELIVARSGFDELAAEYEALKAGQPAPREPEVDNPEN